MKQYKKPPSTPSHPRVFMSRLKNRIPFFVWLLVAILAVFVYFHGGQFGGMSGTVLSRMETAAPVIAGRLDELLVDIGDPVKKGALLAKMDTSVLEAEKALVLAQMHNLSAEVKTDEIQNLRLFDAAIIRIESELRDLRIKQVEYSSERAALRPEIERLTKLVESKLVDEQELMPLRMQILSLEAVTEICLATIKQIETSLATAKEQKETITQQSKVSVELIEKETTQQMLLFDVQIEACNLRARDDGVVSRIYFYPGSTVSEGAPIVSSVVSVEPRIVGFLSEYNARDVAVGMKAYLTPVSGHGPVVEARVDAITPEIYTLPNRASPIMGQVARGRRVIFTVAPNSGLLPGEGVDIHIRRPWTTRILWSIFGKKEGE